MTELICHKCQKAGNAPPAYRLECAGDPQTEVKGTIKCLRCNIERPFAMRGNYLQQIDITLPGAQSDRIIKSVPLDIKEDIQEAERANFAQCYKSCVAMCRRALQLSLIEKKINDQPLGKMLKEALDKNMLTSDTYSLATSIKGFGDTAIHRKDIIEPDDVPLVIRATVKMLNELFKQ